MILSMDIGGSFIKYALLENNFAITKKWQKPTLFYTSSEKFYDYLCQDIDTKKIELIGVSSPGIVHEDSTILSKASPSVAIMHQTNVNKEIYKRLQRPTATINDARAAGLCEVTLGNAKNSLSSVYWLIGTGIGGAIFQKDKLVKGVDNLAGEFSHLPVGIVNGKTRGISSLTSMSALIWLYRKYSQNQEQLTGKEICQRYLDNEELAVQVVEEWCMNIVQGLHLVTIFYNPEIICIGGGISEEDWFIQKIQQLYTHDIVHTFSKLDTTRIERCKYSNDANLIGAAIYASKN